MKKRVSSRQIIFALLLAVFTYYIFTHASELNAIVDALSQGSWRWLLLAVATQVLYFYVYTKMTQRAFLVVDIKRHTKELFPLVLGALFVNVLAPTAGNSGTILFADDAAKRKESSTRAVVGYLVSIVSSYASFFTLLLFTVIFLQRNHLLNDYEVTGALLFILPTVIPPLLLFFANKKPTAVIHFLSWIKRTFNKVTGFFKLKKRLAEEWPQNISDELQTASEIIGGHKKRLVETLSLALLSHLINIISLYVIFFAFDIKIHYGALIAGYVFAEVVRVISPQPEGVGAVEAVIVLIFTSFGVPLLSATAIAIVFRGLNFWAPLGLGFFYLQRLKSFKS
jgi:uncharacterized protein (TIRG00374 family)